ncbi:hypothetical protein CR513_57048, partial [Mucuna pruriens]
MNHPTNLHRLTNVVHHSPLGLETPTEKPNYHKKSRYENIESSNSIGTNYKTKVLENIFVDIEIIATNFEKKSNLMEEKIKTKKEDLFFYIMLLEEHQSWINLKLKRLIL